MRAIQENGEAATPSVSTDSPAKHPTDAMGPHIGKGKGTNLLNSTYGYVFTDVVFENTFFSFWGC
jgi:hypothetical protein